MVDLETTGTDPAHNGILQLAAIKFDYASGQVGDLFNKAVALAPARHWQFACIQWWREDKQRLEHLTKLHRAAVPAQQVLEEFTTWLGNPDKPLRLWAKPIHFEYPFLQSYYEQYGMQIPFHYRSTRDVNTWIAARRGDPEQDRSEVEVPFEGTPHDALFDALHDLRVLLKARELYG